MQGDYLEDLASAHAGKLTSKGRKQGYPDMELSLVAAKIVVRDSMPVRRQIMRQTCFTSVDSFMHMPCCTLRNADGQSVSDRVL